MKNILLFFIFIFLAGCSQYNNDPLEQKIVEESSFATENAESQTTAVYTEPTTDFVSFSTTETTTVIEESKVIVIDPGHQRYGNSDQEPIGPGASDTKAKVTSGTSGKASGLNEYELNLMVSLKLRDILIKCGYSVIMTRQTHDIDISNIERAQIANEANADAFVRIHANASENPDINGAMTICQTAQNPYNGYLYSESRALADCILDSMTEQTPVRREKVWETDTMSGINWAKVPTVIVEMGYMTNPEEDLRMADDEQQTLIAKSIADGIEKYLNTER